MGKYDLSGSILILLTVALIISNLSGCIKGSEDSQYEISDLGKFIGIWVSNSSEISFFPNGTFSSTGGNGTFGIDEGKLCMQYPSKIYELSYTFHNDTTLFIEDTNGNITIYIKHNKFVGTWIGNKEIYISAEGFVLPCCWLAGQMYKWYLPEKSSEIWKIINKYGNTINIKYQFLDNIFKSGIFEDIKNTWNINSLSEGKLKTCALKCGKELDQFGDQYK